LLILAGCCDDCITGDATAGFSAGVEVTSLGIEEVSQIGVAIVNGSNVSFSVPLTYVGSGISRMTTPPPFGYENGTNWTINEDGTIKEVNYTNGTLSWYANLSATTVALSFNAPAPLLFVESINETVTTYRQQVLVTSIVHMQNVHANTTVNNSFPYYFLYEYPSGIDVTTTYKLQIDNTTATWEGFSLSEKRFELIGLLTLPVTEEIQTPRGGGNAPWDISQPEEEEAEASNFHITPRYFDLLLGQDETELRFTIHNRNSVERTYTLEVEGKGLSLGVDEVTLLPEEEREILLFVSPEATDGNVLISDGERVAVVQLIVKQPRALEEIAIQTPAPEREVIVVTEQSPLLNLILLLALVLIGAYYAFISSLK
jgi:hypothetical protein